MIHIAWQIQDGPGFQAWEEWGAVPMNGDTVELAIGDEIIKGIVRHRHWVGPGRGIRHVVVTVEPFKEETKTREGELGL